MAEKAFPNTCNEGLNERTPGARPGTCPIELLPVTTHESRRPDQHTIDFGNG
jgi:hypothetical protein